MGKYNQLAAQVRLLKQQQQWRFATKQTDKLLDSHIEEQFALVDLPYEGTETRCATDGMNPYASAFFPGDWFDVPHSWGEYDDKVAFACILDSFATPTKQAVTFPHMGQEVETREFGAQVDDLSSETTGQEDVCGVCAAVINDELYGTGKFVENQDSDFVCSACLAEIYSHPKGDERSGEVHCSRGLEQGVPSEDELSTYEDGLCYNCGGKVDLLGEMFCFTCDSEISTRGASSSALPDFTEACTEGVREGSPHRELDQTLPLSAQDDFDAVFCLEQQKLSQSSLGATENSVSDDGIVQSSLGATEAKVSDDKIVESKGVITENPASDDMGVQSNLAATENNPVSEDMLQLTRKFTEPPLSPCGHDDLSALVEIGVLATTAPRDVRVDFKTKSLRINIRMLGGQLAHVEGDLMGPIDPSSCSWSLQGSGPERKLVVDLEKLPANKPHLNFNCERFHWGRLFEKQRDDNKMLQSRVGIRT